MCTNKAKQKRKFTWCFWAAYWFELPRNGVHYIFVLNGIIPTNFIIRSTSSVYYLKYILIGNRKKNERWKWDVRGKKDWEKEWNDVAHILLNYRIVPVKLKLKLPSLQRNLFAFLFVRNNCIIFFFQKRIFSIHQNEIGQSKFLSCNRSRNNTSIK